MKQKVSNHFIARIASAVILAFLLSLDLLLGNRLNAGDACLDLWWAALMLLLYPSSHDSVRMSVPFMTAAAAAAVALKLLRASPILHAVIGPAVLFGFIVRKAADKFADVDPLFHVRGVWNWVEDYTWFIHACLWLWIGVVAVALYGAAPHTWAWTAVSGGLYYVEYRRAYTRRTMVLSARKEDRIRKAQRGSAFKPPIQFVDSDSRSATLFNEVVSIMENRKPWLQDDFGVEDLARMTRTNRMYLSKAINFHSGRNFSQLINYYRIHYARDLIRKDPTLKMNEVSRMSGFHTVVSFNMAFKLNERMTPTEYAQSLKKLTGG